MSTYKYKNSWWRLDISLLRQVSLAEHERLPDMYGIAYLDPVRAVAVCYPIPLNLVVRLGRTIYEYLRYGWTMSWFEKKQFESYNRGFRDGVNAEKVRNNIEQSILHRKLVVSDRQRYYPD